MRRHRFVTASITAVSLVLVLVPTRAGAIDLVSEEILGFEVDSIVGAVSPTLVGAAGDRIVYVDEVGGAASIWSVSTAADPVELLADSSVAESAVLGDRLVLVAGNPDDGFFLYVTDGTLAGTERVQVGDGPEPVEAKGLATFGDHVWFAGSGPDGDAELWRTDGTAAGTELVSDINPSDSSNPTALAAGGDGFVFVADDGEHGYQLWTAGGGEPSARRFADVVVDPNVAAPIGIGNRVVFTADLGGGRGLYGTDGTTVEHLIGDAETDVSVTTGPLSGAALLTVGGDDGDHLWRTDGTPFGTVQVVEFPRIVGEEAVINGVLLFTSAVDGSVWRTVGWGAAYDSDTWRSPRATPYGLYVSDGEGGSDVISDADGVEHAVPIGGDELVDELLVAGGRVWFDVATQPEPVCDPACVTLPDQHELRVLAGRPGEPTSVTAVGATVTWDPPTNDGGREITAYTVYAIPDGPTITTDQLTATFEGLEDGQTYTFYVAATNALGTSPPGGSNEVTIRAPQLMNFEAETVAEGAYIRVVGVAGDRVVFQQYGDEHWDLRSTNAAGDEMVLAPLAYEVQGAAALGDLLVLAVDDGTSGLEPVVTDGTVEGTTTLDLVAGPDGSYPSCLTTVGSSVWFSAAVAGGNEPWVTDGTLEGTINVADINVDSNGSDPCQFALAPDGNVVFNAYDYDHGNEPWYSDGTVEGTHLLLDMIPGSDGSNPRDFASVDDLIVFNASTVEAGDELYGMGADLRPYVFFDAAPDELGHGTARILARVGNGDLLFAAPCGDFDPCTLHSISSDGSSVMDLGTFPLHSGSVAVQDGVVFMNADGGLPWRSDGTVAGTAPLGLPMGLGFQPTIHGLFAAGESRTGYVIGDDDVSIPVTLDEDRNVSSIWTAGGRTFVTLLGDDARLVVLSGPPSMPVDVAAVGGQELAIVSWSPPELDGGRERTGYTVTASPGGATVTVGPDEQMAELTGLTGGVEHTFSVQATNELGASRSGRSTATPSSPPTTTTTSTSTTSTTVAPTTSTTTAPITTTTSTTAPTTTERSGRSTTTTSTTRPTTTTTTVTTPPSTTPSTTSTTVAVSTGTGAVVVDQDTGEIEMVEPATPDGEDAAGTVVTSDGETISVTADGHVYSSDGTDLGDLEDEDLNEDIVGIALYTPVTKANEDDELAYWLVGADGGVFSFGGAPFLGSLGGRPLVAPIVGIVPHGRGYWLVGADGGVFAFGGAPFHGSLGGRALQAPITGMTPSAAGYWLVAADGGVFTFGDAKFHGSLGATPSSSPVTGLLPDADGYWLIRRGGDAVRF